MTIRKPKIGYEKLLIHANMFLLYFSFNITLVIPNIEKVEELRKQNETYYS